MMVCGLVISEPIKPKFSTFRFTDRDGGPTVIIVAESVALSDAEPPPETETWFTRGDVAFAAMFPVMVMVG